MRVPKVAAAAVLLACSGSAMTREAAAPGEFQAGPSQRTTEIYRTAVGEALASAADGDYRQAGRIAQDASENPLVTPVEAVHLSTYGTVFFAAAEDRDLGADLADACARLPATEAESVCPRGRAYLDRTAAAARGAVARMMVRWLAMSEAAGAPAWVRDKIADAARERSASL